MIDSSLLRKMGWSEELIRAVTRVAEPMRDYPAAGYPLPDSSVQSAATTAVYSDSVIRNTVRELRVDLVEKPPAKS